MKKVMSCLLAAVLALSLALPGTAAAVPSQDVADRVVQTYENGSFEFSKISHPETPASTRQDQHIDGLVDYLGDGKLGAPFVDEGANGQGDRGQSYSWAAAPYGDWMYVCTQFSPAMATVNLMGNAGAENMGSKEETIALFNALYRGDFFTGEEDGKNPGSVLSKINVKTGEVRILMSKTLNGKAPMFRSGLEFNGKLYFVGAVNNVPSIYEIDPATDQFQCIYKDSTMEDPNAWKVALFEKKICPTIRGMTVFHDHLVISCVGLDGNPYIAISSDPSAGIDSFRIIARSKTPDGQKAELLDYPACRLQDSIYGGSIWEMITFNDRLYVAICTGRPENSPDGGKSMQSFAIIRGECLGDEDDPDAWTWTPIVGDQEEDGAKYTFGIDPQRTRSGACNMIVFDDHLYVGEYNDTEIALIRILDNADLEFMSDNLEQSVSLYRMDKDEDFELVAGNPTDLFPESLSGLKSGFGTDRTVYETQYVWQSSIFQDTLYLGTFDETSLLYPVAQISNGDILEMSRDEWIVQLRYLIELIKTLQNGKKPDSVGTLSLDDRGILSELLAGQAEADALLEANPELDILHMPAALNEDIATAADLHRALALLPALMEVREDWSHEEAVAAKEAFCAFYAALYEAYLQADLPAFVTGVYDQVLNSDLMRKVYHIARCLYYLKDAQCGFDMMSTSDGVHFECVTRTGMGDPYNHGLRAFASNNDPSNPWMCIGTANPFYGTQIWRMEGQGLNLPDTAAAVTFMSGDHALLDGEAASVTVSTADQHLTTDQIPAVVPADACYQFRGWAVRNSDGSFTAVDPLSASFSTDTTLCAVVEDIWVPYRDMKQDRSDWFYQEVRDLSVAGIVNGYTDRTYRPWNSVTWGEALKLVMLASGYPVQEALPGGRWYSGYLALAEQEHLLPTNREIDMDAPLTRLEIAQLAAKALHLEPLEQESCFPDVSDSSVNALQALGIFIGRDDGTFGPQDNVSRCEMALITWRLFQAEK